MYRTIRPSTNDRFPLRPVPESEERGLNPLWMPRGPLSILLAVLMGLAFLVAACSDSPSEPADETPVLGDFEVGPAGGTLNFDAGATVDIPSGAVSEPVEFTASSSMQENDLGDPHQLGALFSIGPSGTQFSQPVRITLPRPQTDDFDAGDLWLMTHDGSGGSMPAASPQVTAETVSGTVNRLSPFWVSGSRGVVTELTVTPESLELAVGESEPLGVEAFNIAGEPVADPELDWHSDDATVAGVVGDGTVRGIAPGETRITVTSGDVEAFVEVVVLPGAPATMELSPADTTIHAEGSYPLRATVYDEAGTHLSGVTIAWSSDDPAVAQVNDEGEVVGTGGGSTVIRASSGDATASASVTVVEGTPQTVEIIGLPSELRSGVVFSLGARVLDEDGVELSHHPVQWSTSNPGVLEMVSGDHVRARRVGIATLTVRADDDVSTSATVRVVPGDPASIEIEPEAPEVEATRTLTLSATVHDEEGNETSAEPTWSTGDEAIATISSDGVVTGVAEGSVEITAEVGALTRVVTLEVVELTAIAVGIRVEPEALELESGESASLHAEAVADDGGWIALPDTLDFAWQSADPSIATVDDEGIVTGLGAGETVVTVEAGDWSAQTTVQVTSGAPATLTVAPSSTELEIGETVQLVSDLRDSAGNPVEATFEWSSSASTVASVNSEGLVTGIAAGSATISVEAGGLSATASVEVQAEEDEDEGVVFADPNLEAVIRSAMDQPTGDILPEDLAELTALTATSAGISDLSGLEHATGLVTLALQVNAISDLSPIAGLTDLTGLFLGNQSGEGISDLSPLVNLTGLTDLYLWSNSITDISPLAGLVNMRRLLLNMNDIADLTPLASMSELQQLNVGQNAVTSLEPISTHTELRTLNARLNSISDLAPVAGLTGLTTLDLIGNGIADISALGGLTALTRLELSDNDITDFSVLPNFTELTYLNLSSNEVTAADVEFIGTLVDLEALWLNYLELPDLTPLAGLTGLTTLNVRGNGIVDISPLTNLTELQYLDLAENAIEDISVLEGLEALLLLQLQSNEISDLQALVDNSGLGAGNTVSVQFNPISTLALCEQIPALLARGVNMFYFGSCTAP